MFGGTIKTLFVAMGCLLVGALLSPARAAAQQSKTVTGCLAKGSAEGSYDITDADGHEYMLSSSKVKLQDHVGHKVTVKGAASEMANDKGMAMAKDTGMAMAKDTSMAMAKDTGMAMGKHEDTGMAGESMLQVSSLKMVSANCK